GNSFWYTGGLPGIAFNQPSFVLDRWQDVDQHGTYQRLSAGKDTKAVIAFNNFRNSTASVEDASYIRLKNVHFSYTLSSISKWVGKCVIYIQGQNLYTW